MTDILHHHAVVLLHGIPRTWYEWRGVIDRLAPKYSIIGSPAPCARCSASIARCRD